MTDNDKTAQELIDEGYMQTSAASRSLGRLPAGKTGLQALADVAPETARRILERAEHEATSTFLRVHARWQKEDPELFIEVDEATFREFKRLRGPVA